MACTIEYIDFVCNQLKGIGEVRSKKMFGDWCIYVDEKPVILACDELCYIKMHPSINELMRDAWTSFPYEGAKEHYILEIEHGDHAKKVIQTLLQVIAYPKKRAKNG